MTRALESMTVAGLEGLPIAPVCLYGISHARAPPTPILFHHETRKGGKDSQVALA